MRARWGVPLLVFAGFGGGACNFNQPPDTRAPLIEIANPTDGSTVSGGVAIDVNAFDDDQVSRVRILIDGTLRAEFFETPYHYVWNTQQLVNNSVHTIRAEANDPAGNVGSIQIRVTVTTGTQ